MIHAMITDADTDADTLADARRRASTAIAVASERYATAPAHVRPLIERTNAAMMAAYQAEIERIERIERIEAVP